MKSVLALLFASLAIAAPTVDRRDTYYVANDVEQLTGTCTAGVIFIFARGSTEVSNLGESVGPPLAADIRSANKGALIQGVNYAASLLTNLDLPYNTDTASINLALNDFREAFTKCPDAVVVAGGYSQGAAIMSAAIPMLTAAQQDKIAGVVLFGDTRYKQDNHQIPGFPTSKTLIYCNAGDGVCNGSLEVTLGHLAYTGDVPGAAAFLQKQIAAASS